MNYYNMNKKNSFSNVVLAFVILFLFLPLITVIIFSFNSTKGQNFTSFSLIWYEKLFFNSGDLWQSILKSLIVALASAFSSTLIGLLAAIGISRNKFKGQKYIEAVTYLPLVIPEVVVGIATLIFFAAIKLRLGLFTIYLAHTTFCLPFAYLLLKDSIDSLDASILEASRDLGATEIETLLIVLIPSIIPSIISSLLLTATISLEDFVITFFVSGPGSTTLPLYVYSMIRYGVSPVINALTFLIVLVVLVITILLRRFLKNIAARS